MTSQSALYSSSSFGPDRLFAGAVDDVISRKVTLVTPENRARGTLLGRIVTAGTVASAAVAGNTGNGVMGAATAGSTAKQGVYKLTIIEPAANAGAFVVEDPDGIVDGHGNVAAAYAGGVNFTLADGATDFISGDQFTFTVSALTYKVKMSVAAAVDGSQFPWAILADDADATAADVEALVYTNGAFNSNAMVYGAGHTAATVRDGLRKLGIQIVDTIAN